MILERLIKKKTFRIEKIWPQNFTEIIFGKKKSWEEKSDKKKRCMDQKVTDQ